MCKKCIHTSPKWIKHLKNNKEGKVWKIYDQNHCAFSEKSFITSVMAIEEVKTSLVLENGVYLIVPVYASELAQIQIVTKFDNEITTR
ncbi:MAG: hypothetical protein COA66_10125 [Arcobacter sp.]|nr:MAG: hypothetical protein COA66_10125 [Arcobacter sp.]